MKKVLFILFVLITFTFIFFISFADGYGTDVEIVGTGIEEYTITVPAKLSINSSGNVSLEGQWSSNRIARVSADESVELTNTVNSFDKENIDVNFLGINEKGSDSSNKKVDETIVVGDFENPILFGNWKGKFNYNVEIVDNPNAGLYLNRTYKNTFKVSDTVDIMGEDMTVFEYIVPCVDGSFYIVYENGNVKEVIYNIIDMGDNLFYLDNMLISLSEDRTKISLLHRDSRDVLAVWELVVLENEVLDNTFPIQLNTSDLINNYMLTFDSVYFVRISDTVFSTKELYNSTFKYTEDEKLYEYKLRGIDCEDYLCAGSYGNDLMVFLVKRPQMFLNIFFEHPGLYILSETYIENMNFEIVSTNNEMHYLNWNTKDVMKKSSVTIDEKEYVKVSDDLIDTTLFDNTTLNVVVDGVIAQFELNYVESSGNVKKISKGDYLDLYVVSEPTTYNGVEFKEAGVYAFNFGKYNEFFNISVSETFPVVFNGNLSTGKKYSFNNEVLTFYKPEISYYNFTYTNGVSNLSGSAYNSGRIIHNFNNGTFGVISKDSKRIKFYKHLSTNYFFEDDVVVFTLDE